jgi:hypothetical protein
MARDETTEVSAATSIPETISVDMTASTRLKPRRAGPG